MLKQFFINRLKEQSTYRGIIVILGIFGVSIEPEKSEAIIAACIAMYGVAEAFFPDKFGKKKEKDDPPVPEVEPEIPVPLANKPIPRAGKDAKIHGQFL